MTEPLDDSTLEEDTPSPDTKPLPPLEVKVVTEKKKDELTFYEHDLSIIDEDIDTEDQQNG